MGRVVRKAHQEGNMSVGAQGCCGRALTLSGKSFAGRGKYKGPVTQHAKNIPE